MPKYESGFRSEPQSPSQESFLSVGDTIQIGDSSHTIERVGSAREYGKRFDLIIPDSIPIYWLSGSGAQKKGGYIPSENIVLFFDNTDEETEHHELVHAVEYHQPISPELADLYKQAKNVLTEDSFEGGSASFNFMKNIHEFIADGRSKSVFIDALKREGLYDAFVESTAYLFA